MANLYLNDLYSEKDYSKAEDCINQVLSCEPTKEFPSCKTYFLRAQARFKQGKFMEALLDISEIDKFSKENFDVKAI
jgi:hypothetical protein